MVWFGLNGKWFYNNANPALGNTPTISGLKIPASLVKIDGFKTSHSLYGDYRALVAGREGTHLEANFGDQPWEYSPPAGFTGFPYQLPELESIANIWDYTTASETIEIRRANFFRGESVSSTGFFSRGMGGDAVLASSPRSSGRWQFELPIQNSSEDVRVGLVPSSFDTRIKQRLGGPGSKGISIQRQYHEMGYDQQMIVEVDGVVHPVGNAKSYQDEAFFTFDCDLDQKRVVIYYDGAKLFETALPAVPEGTSWSIGTTLARAWTDLRTVVPKAGRRVDKNSASSSTEIKFPVRGVKGWTLVDASQSNRAIPMPKPIPAPIPDPISDPVIPMPKPVPEIGKPAPVPGGGRRISPDDEELCSFDPRFGRRCQSRR